MLDQLFGGELSVPLRFIIAFGVVLSLIALTFVGLRRFAGRKLPLANAGRARQPRLGVLDAFAIDARRRLVLIRRDNVEHLIMIGGPNDVLIESEIVRAPAQAGLPAQQQRTQQRPAENGRAPVAPPVAAAPQAPQPQRERERATETPAAAMPSAPEPEIRPAPFRSTMPRSTPPLQANVPPPIPPAPPLPRAPAPARPVRATEPAATLAPPPPVRDEPVAAKPKADVDPLYADIEKKLSEALSRPQGAPPQPARSAPPAAPVRREPPVEAPAPSPVAKEPKSHLDALEEEMASLLGRERPS